MGKSIIDCSSVTTVGLDLAKHVFQVHCANSSGRDILERLDVSQFVSVVGPSGCGKSSLVKVGVVPALRAGLLTRVGYDWLAIETRPGHDPLGNLAAALAELNGPPDREEIAATLAARRSGLWLVVERLADRLESGRSGRPKCVLLVLDPFEEIFARIADPLAIERYVTLITHFFREPHPQLFIVLTMRTDFIGECANFPGMAEIMNKTQYITPVLRGADLMDAITGPAETYGGEVEPALAKAIAEDMGSGAMYDADHLPLMQHALLWLWRQAWRDTDIAEPPNPGVEPPPGASKLRLTLAQYQEAGGLHGVLNRHADDLLASLGDGPGGQRRTAIAETMFRRLSERDASSRYKRAPARMETVRRVAERDRAVRRKRRLVRRAPSRHGGRQSPARPEPRKQSRRGARDGFPGRACRGPSPPTIVARRRPAS